MSASPRLAVVLITASSASEAELIAGTLIAEKLCACVTTIPNVSSRYWWKGNQETSSEVLLIGKTRESLVDGINLCVKRLHSYTVPEVIALPIVNGSRDYLNWVQEETCD